MPTLDDQYWQDLQQGLSLEGATTSLVKRLTPPPVEPPKPPISKPKLYDEVTLTGNISADDLRNEMAAKPTKAFKLITGDFTVIQSPTLKTAMPILAIPPAVGLAHWHSLEWVVQPKNWSFLWDSDIRNANFVWPKLDSSGKTIGWVPGYTGVPRPLQFTYGTHDAQQFHTLIHDSTTSCIIWEGATKNLLMDGVRVQSLDDRFGGDTNTMHMVPAGTPNGGHTNWQLRNFYFEGYDGAQGYFYQSTDSGGTNILFIEDGLLSYLNPDPLIFRSEWYFGPNPSPNVDYSRKILNIKLANVRFVSPNERNDYWPNVGLVNSDHSVTTFRGSRAKTAGPRVVFNTFENVLTGMPNNEQRPLKSELRTHAINPAWTRYSDVDNESELRERLNEFITQMTK